MRVTIVPSSITITDGKISSLDSYADLKPNPSVSPQQYVVVDNIHHPVYPQATYQSGMNNNWIYDPMRDHMAWHTGSTFAPYDQQTMINNYDIRKKVWNLSDLHDWLNKNGEGEVVIQRQPSDIWMMFFTRRPDKHLFESWWQGQQRRHLIMVPIDKSEPQGSHLAENTIKAWCKENLKGQWTVEQNFQQIAIHVKEDDEAVQTKLMFVGGANAS